MFENRKEKEEKKERYPSNALAGLFLLLPEVRDQMIKHDRATTKQSNEQTCLPMERCHILVALTMVVPVQQDGGKE